MDLSIPKCASVVRLAKIVGDDLVLCEPVQFRDGSDAVDTVLRRAMISGRVQVGGDIQDHFADLLNDDGDLVETVALDRNSYRALKNHWMRCKIAPQSHT